MSSGPESLEQIEQPQDAAQPTAGGLADRAERPSLTTDAARESQQAGPAAGGSERQQNDRLADRWGGSSLEGGREPGEALDRSRGDVAFPFDNPNPQAGQMERWSGGLSDEQRAALSDPEAAIHVTAGASRAGSESYNQQLSEARADAVATWLKDHGVRAQITAEGTGEARARGASKPDGMDDPADRVARIVIIPAAHSAEPGPGGHGDEGPSETGHQESGAGPTAGSGEATTSAEPFLATGAPRAEAITAPEHETATHAFWESIEHVSELLMHTVDPSHKIHAIKNWGFGEISTVVATSAHAIAAAHSAAIGDWQGAADHSADMANAAGNFLSGGLLGAVESTVDAAAAVHRALGHEAPTSSELQHEAFHKAGESIADRLYFALHPDARPGAGAGPGDHSVHGD
jgi:outer membrane protein OmpA-like peptidoglycan-associated protein